MAPDGHFPYSPMRETTISVSSDEKDQLDNAKIELFGTDEVPYGAVITELTDCID